MFNFLMQKIKINLKVQQKPFCFMYCLWPWNFALSNMVTSVFSIFPFLIFQQCLCPYTYLSLFQSVTLRCVNCTQHIVRFGILTPSVYLLRESWSICFYCYNSYVWSFFCHLFLCLSPFCVFFALWLLINGFSVLRDMFHFCFTDSYL